MSDHAPTDGGDATQPAASTENTNSKLLSPSTSSVSLASGNTNTPTTMSVSKTLAKLLALPANRSCADCRVTLVDSSQVYASYSPPLDDQQSMNYHSLIQAHERVTPPGYSAPSEHFANNSATSLLDSDDPCSSIRERGLGHGAFVCAMCGAAHKLMAPGIAEVHAVKDPIAWNVENVQQLVQTGNSHCSKTFERFMPDHWRRRRPRANTDIAERLVFIRAKYEALAFCLPPFGPLASDAWKNIINLHPGWKRMWRKSSQELYAFSELDLHQDTSDFHNKMFAPSGNSGGYLPNRLVDFFCVVSAGGELDPKFRKENPNLETMKSIDEFHLTPSVTDCYPRQEAHSDMEFPEHIGSFVYPEGCRPSSHAVSPIFFTFVLTCADGSRLYCGALKLYDKTVDLDGLKSILEESGYAGKTPPWFDEEETGGSMHSTNLNSVHSDIAYLPKCLIVLSHYPFFDLWRKFLLQIYRIALVEAPLPIERFIANFVSEVPLPPPGKIEVRFGFTANEVWSIRRPPDNELPLADFSFQPLFSNLSISSVMVVMGCLLEETRVVLLSKHYALLTPVAEALLSLLFPLHWHGMYIPIMPYSMLDILDAPVPFLVGLHSRYLTAVPPERRPMGVVFVDIDNDIVHLGWNDDVSLGQTKEPRRTPALPEKDAAKLKTRLATSAASIYILPDSGKAGSITYGDEKPLPFGERDLYCHINSSEVAGRNFTRKDFFGNVDKAYDENESSLSPDDFLSGQGLFHEKEGKSSENIRNSQRRFVVRRLLQVPSPKSPNSMDDEDVSSTLSGANVTSSSILDVKEAKGFSVYEVRNAFFRFFVGIFKGYREFVTSDGVFQKEQYVANIPAITPRTQAYILNVIGTQMFERFIQERIENPNDPEVMFFDVSLDAKQNRFRKAPFKIIRNGGKLKDTSFLDDKSKQVTEKFTPPPPSHWGLPDDGRTYHYGSFPELQDSLFGKVRAPKIWAEYQSPGTIRSGRRTTSEVLQAHQSIVNGLLGSSALATSPTSSLTKGKPNTLEVALFTLSRPFMSDKAPKRSVSDGTTSSMMNSSNSPKLKQKPAVVGSAVSFSGLSSDWTAESPDSAQDVVLNARRRASILIAVFVQVQAQSRGYLARHQKAVQPVEPVDVSETVIEVFPSTIEEAGEEKAEHERLFIILQSNVRRRIAQERFRRKVSITITVQSLVRAFIKRQSFRKLKFGILILQGIARGRLTRFVFCLLRFSVSKVQAMHRAHWTRVSIEKILRGRLELYRRQIFILWKRAHTSLAYRTKFWTMLKKSSFLRHNLAEYELERLRDELGLIGETQLLTSDNLTKLSARLGLSNSAYAACLNLDPSLEVDREDDFSQVSSFSSISMSSKSISLTSSEDGTRRESTVGVPFLLTSERTQIYERLSQSSNLGNEQVTRLYDKFNIGVKDKKRKKSLAEAVWRNLDQADESAALMYELFPELRVSDTVRFIEPTRKGIRRFQFDFKPAEFEMTLRAQKLMDDRIRENVSMVASLALCKTPSLLFRLARLDEDNEIGSAQRRQASVKARGFPNWAECRLGMMQQLSSNNLIKFVEPFVGSMLICESISFNGEGPIEMTLDAFRESLKQEMALDASSAVVATKENSTVIVTSTNGQEESKTDETNPFADAPRADATHESIAQASSKEAQTNPFQNGSNNPFD